CARSWSWFAYW
nr:immunoglobulin heavy chain junction region [Mus musculus]MBK4197109.1 immunoglobulin heavy chain junction region [Mus musculus]